MGSFPPWNTFNNWSDVHRAFRSLRVGLSKLGRDNITDPYLKVTPWKDYEPFISCATGSTWTPVKTIKARWRTCGPVCELHLYVEGVLGGAATASILATIPNEIVVDPDNDTLFVCEINESGVGRRGGLAIRNAGLANKIVVRKSDYTTITAGTTKFQLRGFIDRRL